MLHPGDTVPLDLAFRDERNEPLTLRQFLGSWLVVYFYPKDSTPGCTVEAEGFRDRIDEFAALGAKVVGVSRDSCESHQRFIAKKSLNFTLIADTDHALMSKFGTWGKREFMGRTYLGTSRSTFLIDPEGRVSAVWQTVKPAGHAQEVLGKLRDAISAREKEHTSL